MDPEVDELFKYNYHSLTFVDGLLQFIDLLIKPGKLLLSVSIIFLHLKMPITHSYSYCMFLHIQNVHRNKNTVKKHFKSV